MAAAKGKVVIGLTGNIATGKSVVRKMLEHLGAYGIDADALSHRVLEKGAPGYDLVVDLFGKYILNKQEQVDRAKLGKLVFADPDALKQLETIVHPFVRRAVAHLTKNAQQKVVVVEAIKLLESPMREQVDSIWVTTAEEAQQIGRLAEKRNMPEAEARQRMEQQSVQAEKIAAADVVIKNNGSIEDTWKQVQAAWQKLFPEESSGDTIIIPVTKKSAESLADLKGARLQVARGKPGQAEDIASFINQKSGSSLTRIDVMTSFGEKAYMLLMAEGALVGLMGWQVENLVARVDEIWLDPGLILSQAITVLMTEVEEASRELQAEAALVFVPPAIADEKGVWSSLGYEPREADTLTVNAWQEAARESWRSGTVMLFKQLRVDRVLRPI